MLTLPINATTLDEESKSEESKSEESKSEEPASNFTFTAGL